MATDKSTQMVVPRPSWLWAVMIPPWASTRRCASSRPRPDCARRELFGFGGGAEELGQRLGTDSCTGVGDLEADQVAVALERDDDPAAARREPDGVGEQFPRYLLNAHGIGADAAALRIEFGGNGNVLGVGHDLGGLDGGFDDGSKLHAAEVEAGAAGDHAGDVQQVVDHLGLVLGAAVDGLDGLGAVVGVGGALAENAGPEKDGGKGRAKLVGDEGEEFVLHADGRFRGGASGGAPRREALATASWFSAWWPSKLPEKSPPIAQLNNSMAENDRRGEG